MTYDYLIVGQGIAGTILARQLMGLEKKVLVIDFPNPNSSSAIAAGLFHPLSLRKLNLIWKADELVISSKAFYKKEEVELKENFYYPMSMLRIFQSQLEQNMWNEKSGRAELKNFLSDIEFHKAIENPFGVGKVTCAGWLDVAKYMNIAKEKMRKENIFIEKRVVHSEIKISPDEVELEKFRAKKIIFCEGWKAAKNPLFNWLPFRSTKGELLSIESSEISEQNIINAGFFCLPLGNHKFRVGATFDWDTLDEIPTETAKNELVNKLKKVIKVPFKIINHQAGVRPTVKDRQPLLGRHPKFDNVYIFNGMGTRGVLLGPYLATIFCDFLEYAKPLSKEICISRFGD